MTAFLDSSVIVRYLTDDPPEMAERAARIIETDEELILSELVLVETAYVLESVYRIERRAIVEAMQALVLRSNLRPHQLSKAAALQALELCRDSRRSSFVDAFQWALARYSSSRRIYSFDLRFPSEGIVVEG